ncbi:MAG TPA: pantoate--beta-alanine ligase [Xanthobacteraceae bacterium]|jgi:pantoate--beta-alanine ligase|nr:pantoate--beta-alanine ligase [Xanthobacteraceae bacterium]
MKNSQRAKRHPRVIRTQPALRRAIANFRRRGCTIALVPTMGALHEGHFSLVRRAQSRADCVVVSIFVNPTQFAPHEDLTTYPRTFAADVASLAERQVDLVWAPSVQIMYPDGFATRVVPEGPATVGLEDASRPHFFAGVATVVAKLLIQCEPDIALFGEKDYQQLKVVTQLGRDLGLKTRIVGAPIVRERDGLPLSSRNRYLAPAQRQTAPMLYRALKEAAAKIVGGAPVAEVLKQAREAIARGGLQLDYFEARHADTLEPLKGSVGEPIRLLAAVRIGTTRLIDNLAV